jgi:hypothetical protein
MLSFFRRIARSKARAAILTFVFFMAAPAARAADIGMAIAVTPGAFVLRDGKTESLTPRAPVQAADSIRTDASGRVKILFNDDSTLSLGPDTSMDMREYADSGDAPAFAAHVGQGVVRAITGKIVDQNPKGFTITTPEATVGIRGTIISLRVGRGATTVFVENTLRQVFVNSVNVPSGSKIAIIPGGEARPAPILPQDRRDLGRDLALRGGRGVAAAAPEPENGAPGWERLPALRPDSNLPPDTLLADSNLPLDTLLADSNLNTPATPLPAPPLPLTGHVAANVASLTANHTFSGSINFDVNLSSGALNNGVFTGSGNIYGLYSGALAVSLSGGTGSMQNSGGFPYALMDAWTSGSVSLNGVSQAGVYTVVKSPDNLPSLPSGASTVLDYSIDNTSSGAVNTYDNGQGTGIFTK